MSVQRAPVPLPSQSSAPHAESEWQRGRCGMRVFVYTSYIEHLAHQLETGRLFGFPLRNESIHGTLRTGSNGKDAHGDAVARLLPSRRRSCLEDACNYSTFVSDPVSKFGWSIRQYTAEVPIYERIITKCPVTADPESADLFLVPFYFGFMMTLGWVIRDLPSNARAVASAEHREMVNAAREVHKALPHLNERTADRHVFLFTCDSQFVGRDLHPLLLRSIVVHLGDDEYTRHPRELKDRVRRESAHMRNGLVVPYRVSQWLPFGFNIPAPGRRRYLLSMNVNAARHAVRKQIAKIINRTFAQQEIPVERQQEFLVTSKMMGPAEAARIALSSAFCLCPTGDSKGFTARFYFVLLHGCLPVRVDGYNRSAVQVPPAYPFQQLIDWSKIVTDIQADALPELMKTLLEMPPHEIERRQAYVRRIAHWLTYDERPHAHHDAASAVIHSIHHRFHGNKSGPASTSPSRNTARRSTATPPGASSTRDGGDELNLRKHKLVELALRQGSTQRGGAALPRKRDR